MTQVILGVQFISIVSRRIKLIVFSLITNGVFRKDLLEIFHFTRIMTSNSQTQLSSKSNTKRFKWALDYSQKPQRSNDIANPPGYNANASYHHAEITREVDPNLIVKRSWDFALGPIKQVPMNLFLMYMAGNSISIFPIMMVGMLFMRPIKALLSIASAFKMIEGSHHVVQKLAFCFGNLVNLAIALYKCQSMGLLPTHASDWLAFIEPQERMEFYGGGISLHN